MSSGGQVLGGVVGAIAGFFTGGPTGALYGAQIGMMAGGYLDPPKGPTIEGPRLDDLSVQTSSYGAVIPRVYGIAALNGNVFWLENNALKETVTRKKSGGKGGGSKTTTRTYSYSATFAVGLCQGPIVGVWRLWVGPDLIYDAGSSDTNTIVASNNTATGFRIYPGTDTQAPDARMQATLGVANTPAFRGLAYIVFYDLALARYANSLAGAQVRVEVMALGAVYDYPYTAFTGLPSMTWSVPAYDGTVFCAVSQNTDDVILSSDGSSWSQTGIPSGSVSIVNLGCASDGAGTLLVHGNDKIRRSTDHGATWSVMASHFTGYTSQIVWNGNYFLAITQGSQCFKSTDGGVSWTGQTAPAIFGGRSLVWTGSTWVAFHDLNAWTSTTAETGSWTLAYGATLGTYYGVGAVKNGRTVFAGVGYVAVSDDAVSWTTHAAPIGNLSIITDGANFWATGINTIHRSADGITWTASSHPGGTWLGVYGHPFIVCLRKTGSSGIRIHRTFVSAIDESLGNIISTECLQSGLLTAGDIDVVALTSPVRGYRVGSVGAIRAALEPLQGAWPFDVRQHGYQIQFVMRGGASVVTIPAADLDARGAGNEPSVQITTSREMDSQLPRRVTVQHLDYDREYNTGLQYAERLNTAAINAMTLDLPIVLTATEAAGKAEVLLYLYWLERYDVAITLPTTYLHLEPGDVVTLATPEGNLSLRLTAINYTSDGRLECKAKYASAAIYTPTAVASSPAVTGPTTITPVGASVYHLLDLPMINSAQAGPSFLAAMTGALAGWEGGVLMQSIDAGATWASLHDFGAPGAELGTCSNSLGAAESRAIDNASILTVTLTQGALYSITELAMLSGGNHFAYGADGRWEIIAAQTCTLVSGTTYALSHLLRGRYGTEWAMGLHLVGDALILLDAADVVAIAMSTGTIGLSSLYRGITVDRDISTDSARAFAYRGVNLRPLSPIALTGNRNPSSNDWSLTWIRRTRTGGEWRDYVDADLGETSEAYQIDVFADGTYATVKRTITTSTPAAAYASADQVTDFGANQATLYLKVYQMSSVIGRGYPLIQSITR
jgi:hypothetical protein